MLVNFKACAQGFSHIANGKPCQDAAGSFLNREKTVGIAIAADGHGGAKYFRSDVGSALAVAIAKTALWDFYKQFIRTPPIQRRFDENISLIEQRIILKWREEVEKHAKKNLWTEAERPLCDEENIFPAYGTTLLAALIAPEFWLSVQIGDGLCVLIDNDGNCDTAVIQDDEQGFGYTNSICSSDAASKFRHNFGTNAIKGITVATDGVADSFKREDYFRFVKDLYDNVTKTPKQAQTELQAYLPALSEQGSRDDVAIAGIFRMGE